MSSTIRVTEEEYRVIRECLEKKKFTAIEVLRIAIDDILRHYNKRTDRSRILPPHKVDLPTAKVYTGRVGRPAEAVKRSKAFNFRLTEDDRKNLRQTKVYGFSREEVLLIGCKLASRGFFCKKCRKFKDKVDFYKNKQYENGYHPFCYSCQKR